MAKIQITYFNFDQNSIQVSNFTFVNFLITPKKKKNHPFELWVGREWWAHYLEG